MEGEGRGRNGYSISLNGWREWLEDFTERLGATVGVC